MIKRYFLPGLLLFLCTPPLLVAQDSSWVEILQLEGQFRFFETDRLAQLYLVSERDELIKYTTDGKEQFRYHNTTLGQLASVDVADPFSPTLFYPDQQTVLQLDRTLGDRGVLDLRTTEVQNATAIARSHDNNLWVYDDYAGLLMKLSSRGEILLTSDDLRLTENLAEPAEQIVRWGERVLVYFPTRGVAVFSAFGQLQGWWQLSDCSFLHVREDQLFFMRDGLRCQWQLTQGSALCPPERTSPLQQVDIRGQYLFRLNNEQGGMVVSRQE